MTDECTLSQRGAADKQRVKCEGNTWTTDPDIFSRLPPTNPDLDRQCHPCPDVSLNASLDLRESQVELHLGSPEFTTHLASHSSDSSFICQTKSSLDSDQTQNDCLGCDHVQRLTLCSSPEGDKSFGKGNGELIQKKQDTIIPAEKTSADGVQEQRIEDNEQSFLTATEEITDLSTALVNISFHPLDHFVISEKKRVACLTLDINDPFKPRTAPPILTPTNVEEIELKMPHKTHKNHAESKTRLKKDKSGGHHHIGQASKKQENTSHHVSMQQTCKQQESQITTGESHISENSESVIEVKDAKIITETSIGGNEKKLHGKKKKKHGQAATVKSEAESSVDVGNGAKPKSTMGRVDMFEAKFGAKTGKAHKDAHQSVSTEKKSKHPEEKVPHEEQPLHHTDHKDFQTKNYSHPPNDDVIKRRRVSGDKMGEIVSSFESKLPKTYASVKAKEEETQRNVGAARKKAYSEVVKQKVPPKEGEESHQVVFLCLRAVALYTMHHLIWHHKRPDSVGPKVVQPIQAVSVSEDHQSLCLWCQFSAVHSDYTVTWSREGSILAESKRRYFLYCPMHIQYT